MRIAANPAIQEALSKGTLGPKAAPETGGADFAQQLKEVLGDVNGAQNDAGDLQQKYMSNPHSVEVHDVMIGMEKAGVALQLTLAVRNKVLEAYQEVSRMQV